MKITNIEDKRIKNRNCFLYGICGRNSNSQNAIEVSRFGLKILSSQNNKTK